MKSLKKVLAILISAVLMVTAMSVCAFADQYSDAKALNNKKTVSESIKRDVTKLYKVTTASDGEISLDWSTSMEPQTDHALFTMGDTNGFPPQGLGLRDELPRPHGQILSRAG